jgi:hypothetical protein
MDARVGNIARVSLNQDKRPARYVTSNTLWRATGEPFGGSQYVVETTSSGLAAVFLGFIYDFPLATDLAGVCCCMSGRCVAINNGPDEWCRGVEGRPESAGDRLQISNTINTFP